MANIGIKLMVAIIINSMDNLYLAIWEILELENNPDFSDPEEAYRIAMNSLNIKRTINEVGFYQLIIDENQLSYLMLKYSEIFLKWQR